MAVVSRSLPTGPDQVWAVLANGWTYSRWVVGTGGIRAVDPAFPEPGARLHYRFGRWPLTVRRTTTVLSHDGARRLELEVDGGPAGMIYIRFALSPDGDGTRVEMTEHPREGLGKRLHNPLADLLLGLRNRETLRRLEQVTLGRP